MMNFRSMKMNKPKQSQTKTSLQNSGKLFSALSENIGTINSILHQPSDLQIREAPLTRNIKCAVVCLDGLADKNLVHSQILKNIVSTSFKDDQDSDPPVEELVARLESNLPLTDLDKVSTMDDVLLSILSGNTVLFVDGYNHALVIGSKGWTSRAIEEPQTEALIRGPREGFNEDLGTSIALVRRRLRDPNLRLETYKLGRRTQSNVVLAYIDGVVHSDLLKEVKRRLATIDMDDVEGSGYVEQWITDNFLSPFPQLLSTERPDKVTGALLQGRLAILIDGSPFQLILPINLVSCFHSPEDYYQNWLLSTLVRSLRFISAFIATFLPALYIALLEFHHGMLPSKLAFSIAGAREGVPFPAVIEAFIMEGTLELLREAGIRLPKPIGQTIGIVGGLVIGEAAVSAGVVSPIMVIVVAITAISSFTLPMYSFAISLRMIRFGIMLAAALFGLYGIVLAYIIINIHLVNLKSFGIPYTTPFAPLFIGDWKDVVLRAPVMQMNKRPQMMQTKDPDRMKK